MKTGFPYTPQSTEFWNFAIHRIFVFAIDRILLSSQSTEFVMFAIDGIFIFRDRRFKRSNQAIAMSDRRIKRSTVSITLKIRHREFSRNSGIPEKKREKREKSHSNKPTKGHKRPFSSFFFTIPEA